MGRVSFVPSKRKIGKGVKKTFPQEIPRKRKLNLLMK